MPSLREKDRGGEVGPVKDSRRRRPNPLENVGETTAIYGSGTIHIALRGMKQRNHDDDESVAGVLLVALSRPGKLNAFSADMFEDLAYLLDDATACSKVGAVVLTGTGHYFSSGADLSNFADQQFEDNDSVEKKSTFKSPSGHLMVSILRFPKVLACAVNGPAVGIGVTLLLHCDLCYCTRRATFWVPFAKLALVPEFCSSETFVETMGIVKANQMLLMGEKLDASKAVEWNLCAQILDDDENVGMLDPFHSGSIGSRVCELLRERLLSLPLGQPTSEIFVSTVRLRRRDTKGYIQLCKEELAILDERILNGDLIEAAAKLRHGNRSKL